MQDNQENMSTEEILGSIKDILEDNSEAIIVESKINALDEKIDDLRDDEDIFDLSEAQIVMPDLSEFEDAPLANTDAEIVDADFNLVDETNDVSDVSKNENIDIIDTVAAIIEENPVKIIEDDVLNQNNVVAQENQSIENITDNNIETNTFDIIDEIASIVEDAKQNESLQPAVEAPKPQTIAEVQPAVEAPKPQVVAEVQPVVEAPKPQIVAEVQPVVEAPKPQIVAEEALMSQENTATVQDTSVEIINNFAKMFSATPVETKDIDVDVEAVIARSVEKKVLGINFDNIANAQIKKWLNENLSLIVEKVVKEKLEEVLKKNGA